MVHLTKNSHQKYYLPVYVLIIVKRRYTIQKIINSYLINILTLLRRSEKAELSVSRKCPGLK